MQVGSPWVIHVAGAERRFCVRNETADEPELHTIEAMQIRDTAVIHVVQYVPQIIHDSSGELIQLLGTRRLQVIVRPARAHTETGSSLVPNVVTANCPQLLQLKNAGDFEGIVTIGIGVKQLRPFRVFRLANPTRIDATRWKRVAWRMQGWDCLGSDVP